MQYNILDALSPEDFSVLQIYAINGLLLPNLKTLELRGIREWFTPFIPLFLPPRINSVFLAFLSDPPVAMVASFITILPTLCPDLRAITLRGLPKNLMVTTAVSEMLLVVNRNTLQEFDVGTLLTEEASEVFYRLPSLRGLEVVIEKGTRLPSASLPNLFNLTIKCDNEDDWSQLFHGATFGKLEHVKFCLQSGQIGDFLGTFERAALSSSLQNTLSSFQLFALCSWNPSYSSLLPFT